MCVCGHARETKRKSVQNDRCREREKQTEQECQYGEWKEREHESKEGEVQDVISLLHLSRLFILLFFLSFYECLFFFFSFLSGGEYPSDTSYKDFGHCIGTSAGNVWFGGMKGDIMYRLIKFLAMRSDFLNTSFTV